MGINRRQSSGPEMFIRDRAGTDHSNLLSKLCLSSLGNEAVLSGPVGNETLQLTDGDGFALNAADTLSFTLALLRTYAAADCRKCGRQCDGIGSVLEFSFLYFSDEGGDIDIYGCLLYTSHIIGHLQAATL